MLNQLRKLLKEQHRISAIYLLAALVFGISAYVSMLVFKIFALLLFLLALVLVIYRFLYLVNIKRYRKAIFFLVVIGAMTLAGMGLAAYRLFTDPMTVEWKAEDLKGRPAETPPFLGLMAKRPDSIVNRSYHKTHFQLYRSFRDGFYEYDVWLPKIDSGFTYLKGFLLNGDTLRSQSMYRHSRARVFNGDQSFRRFKSNRYIVLYEGGWGPPFPARFEVWYHFNNPERKDSLLLDKIYFVQGMGR